MTPQRIQRKRTQGWRMPEGAVYVGRPTRWGNPFGVGTNEELGEVPTRDEAVRLFEDWRLHPSSWALPLPPSLKPLRGYDLACWCPLHVRCHADVLLELANRDTGIWDLDKFDRVVEIFTEALIGQPVASSTGITGE